MVTSGFPMHFFCFVLHGGIFPVGLVFFRGHAVAIILLFQVNAFLHVCAMQPFLFLDLQCHGQYLSIIFLYYRCFFFEPVE